MPTRLSSSTDHAHSCNNIPTLRRFGRIVVQLGLRAGVLASLKWNYLLIKSDQNMPASVGV